MHELSIASSLIETLLEFAANRGISKIVEVRVGIGEWSCIEPDQLRFCIESIKGHGNPVIEELSAKIETIPAIVRCVHCTYEGIPGVWEGVPSLKCPICGDAAEAVAGHECEIKGLKFSV